MKRWNILLLVVGIILLAISFLVYVVRIGYCYPTTLPDMSLEELAQIRQDCSLESSRVIQFSGLLALFIPGILLCTAYWLVRPPKAQIQRAGPLASFLLLTMFDSLLLAVLALLSYPETGTGSAKPAMILAGLGFASYVSLLGIWQWKRWGLLVFQGAVVVLTVYTGASGLTLFPAVVGIFSAIYLTIILRPLRKLMDQDNTG
jgi:hypothetical protein